MLKRQTLHLQFVLWSILLDVPVSQVKMRSSRTFRLALTRAVQVCRRILHGDLGLRSSLSRQLAACFDHDRLRFESSAFLPSQGIYRLGEYGTASQESLLAIIVMEYHRLEKSISMPRQKSNAALDVVTRLTDALDEYLDRFGASDATAIAASTLLAYQEMQCLASLPRSTESVLARQSSFWSTGSDDALNSCGGFSEIQTAELLYRARSSPLGLFEQRHSIRDFSMQRVDRDLIRSVVRTALRTPSVCNRQEWRLYAIDDRQLIIRCLRHQNGNRGFTDKIPLLFVVAVDLRRFVSVEERNQCWVDGGLFSMSVMLSSLAHGLGSCPLNWCVQKQEDDGLRSILAIPDHEVVVMLIAAGHLNAVVRVTKSTRRPLDEILVFREG